MVRFLHTADWHLGAPGQHPLLAERMLPSLISLAKAEKVDFVLCVGDIFDQPNPTQRVKDALLAQLTANQDMLFVFTVGNHDYTTKVHDYHSLITYQLLKNNLKNVTVCGEGTTLLEGFNVIVLPDDLERIIPRHSTLLKGPANVLAWHGTLPGFSCGKVDGEASKELILGLLKRFKGHYLALGDIHKHIQLDERCWYPGPPVQKTFSDTSGVVLVEIQGDSIKTTSMDLGLPKKITMQVDFSEGKDSEASVIAGVKEELPTGSLVKLKFSLPVKVWAAIDKARIKVELEKGHLLELRLENDPVDEQRNRVGMKEISEAKTVEDEIKTIIAVDSYGLDSAKLMKTCLKYIKN